MFDRLDRITYNPIVEYSLFKPVNESNVKEGFILLVEELILSGRLSPEYRFPSERRLAEHYGVSRPVIHEAFLMLEKRGLVRLRPRHGVVVNDYRKEATLEVLLSLLGTEEHSPGPGLHKDLEHFRIHIEMDMVSLICTGDAGSASDLEELEKINLETESAGTAAEIAELDFRFHHRLALSSGNTLYALLDNTLKPAHTAFLTKFFESPGNLKKVVEYRRQLIEALRKGDGEQAKILIEKLDSYASYRD